MLTKFGYLLEEKRKAAGLSVAELALLSGLPVARIQELEQGRGQRASFDTCYHLSQALAARSGQMFILQDLWLALKSDKLDWIHTHPVRGADNGNVA